MSEYINNSEQRRDALFSLCRTIVDREATKQIIDCSSELIASVLPEDVIIIVDRFIEGGYSIETLKPGISKVLNVLHLPLERFRLEADKQEPFLYSLMLENEELRRRLSAMKEIVKSANEGGGPTAETLESLGKATDELSAVDIHYMKKEYVLFPFFEKTYPRYKCIQLMWSIHDDVRKNLKAIGAMTKSASRIDIQALNRELGKLYFNINTNIFREECILFPLIQRLFDRKTLKAMYWESRDIGFCLIDPALVPILGSEQSRKATQEQKEPAADLVSLGTGSLEASVLERVLNCLSLDMSFIDSEDRVRYFSNPPHRIFPRSKAVIGRKVQNCHPPESVDKVEKILKSFKAGERDAEDFWIQVKGRYVFIRYVAVRDADGSYLGTLEMSQDITELRGLRGEKRLLDF